MSVADTRAFRRKLRHLQSIGHASKKSGLSVSEMIDAGRRKAQRIAQASKKK